MTRSQTGKPKSVIHQTESFLVSITSVYLLYGLKYLFPLLVAPLLAARYGVSNWGIIAIQLSIGQAVSTVVDYGFSISAVRDCALCSTPEEIGELYSRVLSTSVCISFVIVCLFLAVIPLGVWRQYGALLPLLAVSWGVLQGVSPSWYFQATGRFRLFVGIDAISKAVLAIVLVLIRPSGNGILFVLAAFTGAALLSFGIVSTITTMHLGLPLLNFRRAVAGFRLGLPIFGFRGVATLYTTINVPFVGVLLGTGSAGTYALVERLVRGIQGLVGPLGQVLLPKMTRMVSIDGELPRKRMSLTTVFCVFFGAVSSAVLIWHAPFFAAKFLRFSDTRTISALRAMAGLIPLGVLSHLLGVQWLLPSRDDKYFLSIITLGAVLNFVCVPLMAKFYGLTGAAFSVVPVESSVVGFFLYRIITKSRPAADSPVPAQPGPNSDVIPGVEAPL